MKSERCPNWILGPLAALTVVAVLQVSLLGCSYRGWVGVVKIGYVGPFSGYDSRSAYDAYFAVQLAIEKWNQRGQVGGYHIELVALDDENDPVVAATQAREMAADPQVLGVVGYLGPEAAAAAEEAHHAERLAVVTLAPGWEGAALSEVVRLGPSLDEIAEGAAVLAVEQLDVPSVVVLYEGRGEGERGVSQRLAEAFTSRVTAAGVQVRDTIEMDRFERNWPSLEQRVRHSEAELVFYSGGFEPAASFWRAASAGLPGVKLLVSCESYTPDFQRLAGDGVSDVLFLSSTCSSFDGPVSAVQFERDFLALAGREPTSHACRAYDAAMLLLQAVDRESERTRPPTREGVLEALREAEAAAHAARLASSRAFVGAPPLSGPGCPLNAKTHPGREL